MKRWKQLLRLSMTLAMVLAFMLPFTAQAAGERIDPDLYFGKKALAEVEGAEVLLYAYDALVAGVEAGEASIPVYDGTNPLSQAELELVLDVYFRDHTEHFWVPNGYSYRYNSETILSVTFGDFGMEGFIPGYLFSGEELTAARAAIEEAAEEILAGLDEDMSDFEKELYIHDALAAQITYIECENAHNAYGALVEGRAVCEGYAEALQMLLHRAGIPSYMVIGSSINPGTGMPEGHAWNLVAIDDEWYHVDLTWNDQGSTLFHAYFNVTDDEIEEDHRIDPTPYDLPEAEEEEANYFTVYGGRADSFDAEAFGQMLKANGGVAHIYTEGSFDVNKLNQMLNVPGQFGKMLEAAGVTGSVRLQEQILGREVILILVTEKTTAVLDKVGDSRLTVTVRGAEAGVGLFFAVYDEDGRMIGIAQAENQTMSQTGTKYTVSFDGAADHLSVFRVDEHTEPHDLAIEIEIE